MAAAQLDLDRLGSRDGGAAGEVGLMIDRLANRLGLDRVLVMQPQDTHIPERAMTLVPALRAAPVDGGTARDLPWQVACPRPIRLLAYPEPVEVMAPVPDDPPILFRRHRRTHHIRQAEGPERIAAEWWRDSGQPLDTAGDNVRDYYRVEDDAGRRFLALSRGSIPIGHGAALVPARLLHVSLDGCLVMALSRPENALFARFQTDCQIPSPKK